MSLPDVSIKRPIFMSMVLFAILLFGTIAFRQIGIDLYPKVEFPVITIVSTLPGADPETVENTVTDPIEEAVSSINSIKHLRSTSGEAISQVVIEFELEKNGDEAYQEVQAKIGALRSKLPQDVQGPVVEKYDIDSAPVLTLIVSGEMPLAQLTHLADKEVKQTLQRISKVGQIKMIGGRDTKIWLWIDRNRLQSYHLTMQDVEQAIKSQHIDLASGRLTKESTELLMKTKGEFRSPEEFSNVIVAHRNGMAVHFGDIGYVEEGLEEERTASRLNGTSAIALLIGRQSGANTVEVTKNVKKAVEELKSKLSSRHVSLEIAQDNSLFIEHSVDEVRFHLLFGGGLAILIVLLFLRNFRSTVVCALALPTAVIGTFAFMSYMDFSQNMMTLLALSIAIGLLIDDAIVVQENIIRHMEHGRPAFEAASIGTSEITLAVLATTLSVVAVFVPVAFMKGIVGRFFYQFGLTVSFAVLISMFVSFTLNPLFSSRLLKSPKRGKVYALLESGFEWLENRYAALVRFSLRHKALVIGVAFASFVGALFVARFLRFEFIPLEDQSEFSINLKANQEASLQQTARLLDIVEERVKEKPWVEYLFSSIGSDALQSVNLGSIYVKMTEKNNRTISQQSVMGMMRKELADIVDCQITVEPVQRMSGGGRKMTDIQLELRGSSLEELNQISAKIQEKLKRAHGYVDISSSYETGKPEADIWIKRETAADFGITPALIAKTIKAAFGGETVTTIKRAGDRYDVAIRFLPDFRKDIHQVQYISVKNTQGELIPLQQLVELRKESSPMQIDRYNRVRQVTVYANLDRSQKVLGEAIGEINQFMQGELPEGYSYGFTGMASDFKDSFFNLVFALFLAVIIVYMVLAAQFESLIHPLIIMLSLPLSIVGALGALVLFNMTMSIFTMIGMIMLMGLVTKNGILLVDFIKQIAKTESLALPEAIVKAGTYRLRPILMTTFAVILGMLPVALGAGAGSESRAPMAVAVIGGLITSTLLTLIVIPVAYLLVENFREKKFFKNKIFILIQRLSKKMKNEQS